MPGVVPGADNSEERESEHEHVKHSDVILKYAVTCAVSGDCESEERFCCQGILPEGDQEWECASGSRS